MENEQLRLHLIRQILDLPSRSLPAAAQALQPLIQKGSVSQPVPSSVLAPPTSPDPIMRDWPHSPVHRLSPEGSYMVTCGTYLKLHHDRTRDRLDHLTQKLLTLSAESGWNIEGWAVFSNHYHIIAHSQPGCDELDHMLKSFHAQTAQWVNALDNEPGRQVWYNFWDTRLTYEKSYLAWLNYVQQNPVHHRLVAVARDYPWCSAGWFERTATPAQVKTVASFRYDRVKVVDDFEPVVE